MLYKGLKSKIKLEHLSFLTSLTAIFISLLSIYLQFFNIKHNVYLKPEKIWHYEVGGESRLSLLLNISNTGDHAQFINRISVSCLTNTGVMAGTMFHRIFSTPIKISAGQRMSSVYDLSNDMNKYTRHAISGDIPENINDYCVPTIEIDFISRKAITKTKYIKLGKSANDYFELLQRKSKVPLTEVSGLELIERVHILQNDSAVKVEVL